MKLGALLRAPIILCALTPLYHLTAQQGQPIGGYQLLNTIVLPSGLAGNDISWVDTANARYYLADRGNATASPAIPPRIEVIDTAGNRFLTSIPLTVAANGILAIPRAHELWAGLNDSTVAVIDTTSNAITHVISTGGKSRADELAYDPDDHLILIANDRDTPPFVSFISTANYSVLKTLPYDGTSAPQSTGGIEQSVWDELTGKFYIAIPATSKNANGEIDEIDPMSMAVTRSFPTVCKGPSGLALIPNQRLITACGDVVDVQSGQVVTTVSNVSGDEIWYNPGDQRVYFGGSQKVYVVDANSYSLVTSLVVGVPAAAPAPAQSTHSLAADSDNNEVLVAVSASGTGTGSGVGIQVWRNGAALTITPNPIAVTDGADGSATISWNAPNASLIEVHVNSPTGPLFARSGNRGRAPTGVWVSDGLTFYLQDVSNGQTPGPQNTLATAVAHLSH
jgi:DNA-binding beta-propeller fold protein YncE